MNRSFHPGKPQRGVGFLVTVVGLGLLTEGCGRSPEAELRSLVPDLDPVAARALVGPDSLWKCHCRDAGNARIRGLILHLRSSIPLDSQRSYEERSLRLSPYLQRAYDCMRDEYRFGGVMNDPATGPGRPYEEAVVIKRINEERVKVTTDTTLTTDEKLVRFERYESECRRIGYPYGVSLALQAKMRIWANLGKHEAALACLREAMAVLEPTGRSMLSLSYLITMAEIMGGEGKADSMRFYEEKALHLAEESRESSTISRVYRRWTFQQARRGRFAIASELNKEATRLGREYNQGQDELVPIEDALELYTVYGIPEMVDDALQRADVFLAEQVETPASNSTLRVWQEKVRVEVGTYRARRLIETGQVEEGERLFRSLRAFARRAPEPEKFTQLHYAWSTALLHTNRSEEAARLAREGLAYAVSHHIDSEEKRFTILLAEALSLQGHGAAAESVLVRFREILGDDEGSPNAWLSHDCIRVRSALAAGDTLRAEALADTALLRVEHRLRGMDQSATACIFLDRSREFRQLVHAMLAEDPEAGYGFEMRYRALYRKLGHTESTPRAGHELASKGGGEPDSRTRGAPTSIRLGSVTLARSLKTHLADATHVVYFQGRDEILRWTATRTGVRRDVLPIHSEALCSRVAEVSDRLAVAPPRDAAPELTRLAGLLLPPEVLLAASDQGDGRSTGDPAGHLPLLLISPDLCLAHLPFAALDPVAGPDYQPLIETHDIAYLRHASGGGSRDARSGLVVCAPSYPPELVRRYAALRPLPQSEREAARVVAAFPGSRVLRGEQATKGDLASHWETVGFLYVASHFVQDGETPYVSFLPLAAPEGAPMEAGLLDYADVRSADLSRCRLVVLSGCETGVGYMNGRVAGPSLGDAFLDAGAAAVVHTFWNIQDPDAAGMTEGFIREWARGSSAPRALNQASRFAWRQTGATIGPAWMAYAVTLSRLP